MVVRKGSGNLGRRSLMPRARFSSCSEETGGSGIKTVEGINGRLVGRGSIRGGWGSCWTSWVVAARVAGGLGGGLGSGGFSKHGVSTEMVVIVSRFPSLTERSISQGVTLDGGLSRGSKWPIFSLGDVGVRAGICWMG